MADFLTCVSILHTKDKDHLVLDTLSRLPAHFSALTISVPCPTLLSDLYLAQERNSSLGGYQQLAKQGYEDFHYEGPILIFKSRLVIPNDKVLDVLREMHDNQGHFG